MAARAKRLSDPELTYKTASVWLKLFRLVWTGLKALLLSFMDMFTKKYWKDMWSDTKQICAPLSSCGICLNAYSCGLVCNPATDDGVGLPTSEERNGVVA